MTTQQTIERLKALLERAYAKLDIANGIVDPYDPEDIEPSELAALTGKDNEPDLSFCGPLCRSIRDALGTEPEPEDIPQIDVDRLADLAEQVDPSLVYECDQDGAQENEAEPLPDTPTLGQAIEYFMDEVLLPFPESSLYKDYELDDAEYRRALATLAAFLSREMQPLSLPDNYEETERLRAYFHAMGIIPLLWCVDDVRDEDEGSPHLSREQAWDVLAAVEDDHDAEWGICWQTLRDEVRRQFPGDEDEEGHEDD